MKSEFLQNWLLPLMVISLVYLGAFAFTFGVLMPAQTLLLPEVAHHASLLFLPHGIRVLTAWLYGWRALLLLTPSSLLTHAYLFGALGFSSSYFFAALFGIFCATSSFWLFEKLGMDFHQEETKLISWREILLAGSFASLINAAGSGYVYGFEVQSASVYFLGDLGGLMACMVILMFVFRWMRRAR